MGGEETAPTALKDKERLHPPELNAAILEARRYNRSDPERPELTEFLMDEGLEGAKREFMVSKNNPRRSSIVSTAEELALKYALKGHVERAGDFIELAREDPDWAEAISPETAYAILAVSYDAAARDQVDRIQTRQRFGIQLTQHQIDQVLQQKILLLSLVKSLREKAGEKGLKHIADLLRSPKF